MADFVSVSEAATIRKVTRARILDYIEDKRLPAQLIGKQYMIKKSDLSRIRIKKSGRPKKPK